MPSTLEEGSVFDGRYQIIRRLGAGGMGAVYEVVHVGTRRPAALKVMLPHLANGDFVERFLREASFAAKIGSEYVVEYHDAGHGDGTTPYLVMELLRGENLEERLERVGRLPPEEVIAYMAQLAHALDKIHAASIVHRDLKPANLFLSRRDDGSWRLKVLDFGIAKALADGPQAQASITIGTPLFMAPEQFRGGPVSMATDRYALAMIAYALLVGDAYWAEEGGNTENNVFAFAAAVVEGQKEPATARARRAGARLPAAFDAWFARAAAVSPDERFETAVQSVDALAAVFGLSTPPLSARVAEPPGHPARRWILALASIAAPALAVLLFWTTTQTRVNADSNRASNPVLAEPPPAQASAAPSQPAPPASVAASAPAPSTPPAPAADATAIPPRPISQARRPHPTGAPTSAPTSKVAPPREPTPAPPPEDETGIHIRD